MSPEDYGKLTDKEIWFWYVKPGIEKAERMKQAREGKNGGKTWEPQTEEEVLLALSMLGLSPPAKE